MNSKAKGKRGELEWAHFLTERGYAARRGQQFAGSPDSPDVVCQDLDWIHWEVKRDEHLNVEKALLQAQMDKGSNQTAVVAHRKNSEKWKITLDADDFLLLVSTTTR